MVELVARERGQGWLVTSLAEIDFALVGLRLSGCILSLASSTLGQIGLMSLALCVCQVIPLIVVQCQT